MASTNNDYKQPGKARKLADTVLSQLKKDHQMQERMERMIEAGKSASVASARGVAAGYDVTKRSAIRGYNIFVVYTLRALAFLGYVIAIFLFLPTVFTRLTDLLFQLSEMLQNYLPILADFNFLLNWVSLYLSIFAIGSVLLLLFPLLPFDRKEEVYGKVSHLYLILGILMIVGGLLYGFFFTTGYTFEDRIDQTSSQVEESSSSLVERVTCYMDTACINKRLNQNEAEQAKTSDYELTFTPPKTATPFNTERTSGEIYLDFSYKSSGGMYLNDITCYHEEVSESNAFYHESFNESLGVAETTQPLRDMKCGNLFDIPRTGADEEYDIIVQLSLSIDGTYSQQIPVVNYPLIEERIPQEERRTMREARSYLHDQTEEFNTFKQNNDALRVATGSLLPQLPVIIGEGETDTLSFLFSIEEQSGVEFGTFERGRITDISLPPVLQFEGESSKDDYLSRLELGDDQIFERQIVLEEDEGGIAQEEFQEATAIEDAISVYDLQFLTTSTFTKEVRFSVRIIDEDYGSSPAPGPSEEDEPEGNNTTQQP